MKWFSNRGLWSLTALLALWGLASIVQAQSSLPAFPGAEGYGSKTRAAYGGATVPTVYRVTNLNDAGTGSLRAALTATVPRVVIFEVSGYISLSSAIAIQSPYLTVAGETAPSPGITVRNDYVYIATHDVVIRHLRIRPSSQGGSTPLQSRQGISVEQRSYNVVIDHCSISWSTDDSLAAYSNGTHDVTFTNNIVSEGLYDTYDTSGSGGLVAVGGTGSVNDISFIRNLNAHNARRNPQMYQQTITALVNNVYYNWALVAATGFIGTADNGPVAPAYSAVVGNRYIGGPNTSKSGAYGIYWYGNSASNNSILATTSRLYKSDNTVAGVGVSEYVNQGTFNPLVSTPPAELNGILSQITVLPGGETEGYVLAHAGARPADRDSHDARIVSEVSNRTGSIKGRGNFGAWPTLGANTRTLALPANPHTVTSSGYTNLELWLHGFAREVEGVTTSSVGPPPAPTGLRIVSS